MTIAGMQLLLITVLTSTCNRSEGKKQISGLHDLVHLSAIVPQKPSAPKSDTISLDTAAYNTHLLALVHNTPSAGWPVKTGYPLPGAILPFKRIVAYYGNFYSAGMGILGELPPDEVLEKLKGEVKKWEDADTAFPVLPAIHYIAVSAQKNPGKDNKYRLRMPFNQVDKALEMARKINGILILDVQVGHSTVAGELPELEPYLRQPNVHLAIDPEYSMKGGEVPCSVIGTMDAADINYAAEYLARLTHKFNIPPKILIVHRFTKEMVTNYKQIILRPEVQVVMDMDGFGFRAKKADSYKTAIAHEPVQFTGFKLFYKNDVLMAGSKTIMEPSEILKLNPVPIYIQYQ